MTEEINDGIMRAESVTSDGEPPAKPQTEERPNVNCLEGIRCPKCGSHEPFYIGPVDVTFSVYDSGTSGVSDPGWDDDTDIACAACQHTAIVAEFKTTRASAPISAECHSDDRVVEVEFNAAPWFEQVDGERIVDLARCGWGGDYPADVVATYMAERSGGVRRLFQYLSFHDDMGFECHVNDEEAMAYLAAHRPELHELITRERGE